MDIHKKQAEDFRLFSEWLDKALCEELPKEIVAFNFNLYEGVRNTYDIQLIGCDEFDEEDTDWACAECFTTGEDICYIQRSEGIIDWEDGLKYITELVEKYINEGKNAKILKSVSAVAIGFVDGDIQVIYHG